MRLGDLDRLYDCVEARYRQSSGDEHKCERALLDAICEMPTVDAIPVEWLEHLREKQMIDLMMGIYGVGDSDICHAISVVLDLWQKEQEARA